MVTLENNLAIIRLSTNATLNAYVQPVCLWSGTESAEMINAIGTVIGWKVSQTTTGQYSNELQKILLPVAARVDCLAGKTETFLGDGNYCIAHRDGIDLS